MKTLFIYIVNAWIDSSRTPVAAFQTRDQAERCVRNTLKASLRDQGLDPSICDRYTVDQWAVGGLLDAKACVTLTSYTPQFTLDRELVPRGREGEAAHTPARLRMLFDSRDDLEDLWSEE